MKWLFLLTLLCGAAVTASAHPADISYLRVKVERQRMEMRFTFNLLTLTRFAAIDADQDHTITLAELKASQPLLLQYLRDHTQVRINDQPADLGEPSALIPIWPAPESNPSVHEEDWSQRHVDLVFTQSVQPVLEDVSLSLSIWPQAGRLASVEATFEQDDTRTHVPFSQTAPAYRHDTGYLPPDAPLAVDPFASPAPPSPAASHVTWPLLSGAAMVILCILAFAWRRIRN